MDVKLPDGTVISNVPDNITQTELISRLDKNGYDTSSLKPKAEPSKLGSMVASGLKGFQQGGPLGFLQSQIGEAAKTIDDAITKGAYKAGEKVTDVAASAGLSPETAAKFGYATNIGIQAVPAFLGGRVAQTAAPAMERAAADVMQSALKPPLADLRKGNAAKAIQTMLDEGINVSKGGVQKLRSEIENLNYQIADAIRNSPATVDKNRIWASIKDTLDRFTMQANPQNDLAAIRAAWDKFISHPLISGDTIPVQLAQQIKQGTYKIVGKKYGELGSAETEAQKAIARGLKEEVATAVPEVASLNARESSLINALTMNERRVLIAANKNPAGLALLTSSPERFAAFMADKSEAFKSLIARAMYSGSERIPQAVGGTGTALIESSRQRQE